MNLTRVYIPDIIISQVGLMHQGFDDTCRIVFCRIECQIGKSVQISFCLQINHDFSWSVVLYQQQIEYSTSTVLNRFSLNLNSAAELCQVIQALESSIICQGNPDEKFTLLYSYKKGIFKDQSVMYIL